MSTYPGVLDDLGATNPSSSTQMDDGAGHAAQHSAANDAIDAIQATLGVDPQGGSTDVATRLDDLAFADLADVDMSGISDGDAPVWNAGTSKFEPGAGGGGGLADASRLWTPGSGVTTADEFDDASLAGAWTRVDKSGGTGRATWTEEAGCLSLLMDGTSTTDSAAELHGLVQSYALSVGEYIETHLSWAGKDDNYPMAGLVIADGATFNAGTQVFGGSYRATSGGLNQIAAWTNWSTRGTYTDNGGPGNAIAAYLRLKRTATSDYALYTSPDGVSWALLNTRTGVSFTPAYVGFACSLWGAAVQFAWSFGYFRIGS